VNIKLFDAEISGIQKQARDGSSKGSTGAPGFESVLGDSVREQKKRACAAILEEIDGAGADLKKAITVEGVKRYSRLVAAFMKEALKESYSVGEEYSWDRMGNRKNFLIVRQVNRSLEELMETVINQEKPRFDIVAKLEEIRGWLVDLYL